MGGVVLARDARLDALKLCRTCNKSTRSAKRTKMAWYMTGSSFKVPSGSRVRDYDAGPRFTWAHSAPQRAVPAANQIVSERHCFSAAHAESHEAHKDHKCKGCKRGKDECKECRAKRNARKKRRKEAGGDSNSATSSSDDGNGRCWKGYEPVPGKKPYSDGSCRKKRKHD